MLSTHPRECKACGRGFVRGPDTGTKYCSTVCWGQARAKADLERNRKRKGYYAQRTCACCGVSKERDQFGGHGSLHCLACIAGDWRSPQARILERSRIAAKAGKAYRTAEQRSDEKRERVQLVTINRALHRMRRCVIARSKAVIRKAVKKAAYTPTSALASAEQEARRQRYRRAAANKRKHIDYRIHKRVSTMVRAALGAAKAGRQMLELLGYSASDLKQHLDRQFTGGGRYVSRHA